MPDMDSSVGWGLRSTGTGTEARNLDTKDGTTSEKYRDNWSDDEEDSARFNQRPTTFAGRLQSTTLGTRLQLLVLVGCAITCIIILQNFITCKHASVPTISRLAPRAKYLQAAVAENPAASATSSSAVLDVFQVYQPVLTPSGPTDQTISGDGSANTTSIEPAGTVSSCSKLLMEYSFGFSYGMPFLGNYTPPSCKFNRVVMNLTVTSRGRQFDRLALMYFGDTEVFRTSTAEPTQDGIIWTYIKDMSEYSYFWNSPQKLIFDLGNLIDDTYTGYFNTTLTATFFTAPDTLDPASLIIPISARKSASNGASLFMLPADTAANTIDFPRNANRAVFSVSACGQANEEFWWSNVLQSDTNTFLPADGVLFGFSPWREVQIYIDGRLAGVQWPFPVIFTGGVAPGLWRPIVGIDAFDLREHQIDITPWLPLLSDGTQHTFEIKVAGINDDGGRTGTVIETVGSSWYVTGKIFLWLDDADSITTGTSPSTIFPDPHVMLSQSHTQNASTGVNETLTYSTLVTRSLSVSSVIRTQKFTSSASWTQSLSYSNHGSFRDEGNTQVNTFGTTGFDTSTGAYPYSASYNFPLFASTTFISDPVSGNFSISAVLSHGLDLDVDGASIYPSGLETFAGHPAMQARSLTHLPSFSGSVLHTTQNGSAYYFSSPTTNTGLSYGSTQQSFSFAGATAGTTEELYSRDVAAANGTVVSDREVLVNVVVGDYRGPEPPRTGMARLAQGDSPRAVLGRGPGQSKPALAQGGGA